MLYETFGELKSKYRNREFWCKGDYVDTVGKNEKRISEYTSHQLEADRWTRGWVCVIFERHIPVKLEMDGRCLRSKKGFERWQAI
mgnify:CR=1 FL=1